MLKPPTRKELKGLHLVLPKVALSSAVKDSHPSTDPSHPIHQLDPKSFSRNISCMGFFRLVNPSVVRFFEYKVKKNKALLLLHTSPPKNIKKYLHRIRTTRWWFPRFASVVRCAKWQNGFKYVLFSPLFGEDFQFD